MLKSLAILPENGFQLLSHNDLRFLHHALFLKFVLFRSNFSPEHQQIKVKLVTCANFFFSSSNNSLLGQWMKQKLNSKLVICAHFVLCTVHQNTVFRATNFCKIWNWQNKTTLVMPSSGFIFLHFIPPLKMCVNCCIFRPAFGWCAPKALVKIFIFNVFNGKKL